jgi:hypothetical protein
VLRHRCFPATARPVGRRSHPCGHKSTGSNLTQKRSATHRHNDLNPTRFCKVLRGSTGSTGSTRFGLSEPSRTQ